MLYVKNFLYIAGVQDVLYIDDVEQAAVLLKPARLDVLKQMASDTTCTQLAEVLGGSPQKIYYHVKALEQAGLVEKVAERKVRGIVEGIYRARARSYWLAPKLVGAVGGERRARDQASLGYLIQLFEEVQEDVARLADEQPEDEAAPSLGLSAHIQLRDAATRRAFMRDVQDAFQALATKYGATRSSRSTSKSQFRIALACYPAKERKEGDTHGTP